jgi:hypothetical protein
MRGEGTRVIRLRYRGTVATIFLAAIVLAGSACARAPASPVPAATEPTPPTAAVPDTGNDGAFHEDEIHGENTTAGEVVSTSNLVLYANPSISASVVDIICNREPLTILTNRFEVVVPGLAVLTRPHAAYVQDDAGSGDTLRFQVGDTVRIASSRGEGYYGILQGERVVVVQAFWPVLEMYPIDLDAPARLIRALHVHEWYQVRTWNGRIGYVLGARGLQERAIWEFQNRDAGGELLTSRCRDYGRGRS